MQGYIRVIKGDTRSLDFSSHGPRRLYGHCVRSFFVLHRVVPRYRASGICICCPIMGNQMEKRLERKMEQRVGRNMESGVT